MFHQPLSHKAAVIAGLFVAFLWSTSWVLINGLVIEGMPTISSTNWAFIAWLAVVNTAFAFTLWNHVQRTLSAVESSIINSTILVQIAILAWLFLGETLSLQDVSGMALVMVGTLVVQVWKEKG